MTKFELERFTYKTKPDMKIIDAVYKSCSMPLFFNLNILRKIVM